MAGEPDDFLDGEVPEMSEAQLSEMRPAREVMTTKEFAAVTGRGRPRAAKPKVPVTIRLDPDVVEAYKSTGPGWQTKVNATLRASVIKGKHFTVTGSGPRSGSIKTFAASALSQGSGPRRGRGAGAGTLSSKPKGGKKA